MIQIDDTLDLEFAGMGLFETDAPWTHPIIAVKSYELIFALAGELRIFEEEERYRISPGELLLLSRDRLHGGYGEKNTGRTSFFWLHFHTTDITPWQIPTVQPLPADAENTFRELMHLSRTDRQVTELVLAKFLLQLRSGREYKSRLAYEVQEYLRLEANTPLTVTDVARHFGYSGDHLSRLYRKEFGCDLKSGIVQQRLLQIETLLINTDYPIREISLLCGFEDENIFVKFFKYHEKLTPTMYRNRFFRVHRNKR